MLGTCDLGTSWDVSLPGSRVSTFGDGDDGIVSDDSVGMFCQEEEAAPVFSLGVSS